MKIAIAFLFPTISSSSMIVACVIYLGDGLYAARGPCLHYYRTKSVVVVTGWYSQQQTVVKTFNLENGLELQLTWVYSIAPLRIKSSRTVDMTPCLVLIAGFIFILIIISLEADRCQ